jgi:hypothetical protein
LPTRDLAGLCVWRLHNIFGNSSHWTDGAWLYATFCCFMATFVLAATAAPARVIGCREDCGRLSGGWVIHSDKATGYIRIGTVPAIYVVAIPISELLQPSNLLDQP